MVTTRQQRHLKDDISGGVAIQKMTHGICVEAVCKD